MIDYERYLLGPIYDRLGVDARLATTNVEVDVRVLDDTRGIVIDTGGPIGVGSIRPAVSIRQSELDTNRILPADLKDGRLTLNGKNWLIKTQRPKPGARAEIQLILIDEEPDV